MAIKTLFRYLLTDNSHDDVDVGTLNLGEERKYFFQYNHFVKTV